MSYFNKYIIFSLYPEYKDAYYDKFDSEKYTYDYNYTTICFLLNYSKMEYYKTFFYMNIFLTRIFPKKSMNNIKYVLTYTRL